jgi:hypothetical protein
MVTSLARELATALDPVLMLEAAGIVPDPWQAQAMRSPSQALALNCSRQSGKSTVAAGMAVHTALYEPGAPVLLLSPSLRQSQELFRKCLDLYRMLGRPIQAEAETKLQLELENGSRIIALPGKEGTIRGYSGVRLLIVDEASRVVDDLYRSVRPMLAVSGGRLVTLSTPFGTRGWWYEAWEYGGSDWERIEVPATACPRIPAAFLASEKAEMGEWWFGQEYLCQFLDAQTQAFRRADIDKAFSEDVETWAL